MTIKNREQVIEQLAEMLFKFDIEKNRYQTDVYAYYNKETQEITLDTFVNVGGNSWLNDDHFTIYKDKEHYEGIDDAFTTIDELAEAVNVTADELISKVADYNDLEIEDVAWYEVARYCMRKYSEEMYKAYEEIARDNYNDWFVSNAEYIIDRFEETYYCFE